MFSFLNRTFSSWLDVVSAEIGSRVSKGIKWSRFLFLRTRWRYPRWWTFIKSSLPKIYQPMKYFSYPSSLALKTTLSDSSTSTGDGGSLMRRPCHLKQIGVLKTPHRLWGSRGAFTGRFSKSPMKGTLSVVRSPIRILLFEYLRSTFEADIRTRAYIFARFYQLVAPWRSACQIFYKGRNSRHQIFSERVVVQRTFQETCGWSHDGRPESIHWMGQSRETGPLNTRGDNKEPFELYLSVTRSGPWCGSLIDTGQV